jgi:hypothetical protein
MAKTPLLSLAGAFVLVAGSALAVACSSSSGSDTSGSSGSTGTASAKLSDIRSTTFKGSCALSASCHSGSNPAGYIDLSDTRASADIIAALKKPSAQFPAQGNLAVPGMPDASFLYHKVAGDSACLKDKTCGDIMPQTGPKISAAQIQSIHDWIAGGMQDN